MIQKYGSSTTHYSETMTKSAMQHLTTEDLFRLRDEQEKSIKEKCVQYSNRLRKRSPKKYTSATEFLSPVIKQKDRYRDFFRSSSELIYQ